MPTEVQFRRGTTAQNNSFTGAAGELSVNTTNNSLRIHDGSTAGGFEVAKADLSNTVGTGGTLFAENVGIGTTIVITSAFQLQNIASIDATTTATIEAAITTGSNDFSSINVSGIGTVIGEFNVGTGGTVLTALSQVGISSVGIASAIPTATLDVFGNVKVSSTLLAANSAVELNTSGINISSGIITATTGKIGVVTFIDSGIFTPNGIVTATTFSGELVGAAVTSTSSGLFVNTGISSITKIKGDLDGQVLSGIATVNAKLAVTGIATFNSSAEFTGFTTFHANSRYLDNIKLTLGSGSDLELYQDGSNSYIKDNGGGNLRIEADPLIELRQGTAGIATVGAHGLDVVGGTNIGHTGIVTFTEGKVGSAVTFGAYGLNISGGTHVSTAGIATVQHIVVGAAVTATAGGVVAGLGTVNYLNATHLNAAGIVTASQTIVGSAVTAADSGLDAMNVKVGTALTVVGVSTMSGLVNVGVDTSVGVVMTAANGTRYRLFVENDGSLSTIALS